MNARCEAIACSLLGVAKKHGKKYCFVSQKRLLELITQYHGYGISNRTLNRDLRELEDEGFIERVRRIRRDNSGKPVFICTLYKFTGKLFNYLVSLGNVVKRIFGHFRLPKLAVYQLSQKRASSSITASSGKSVVFMGKDGRAKKYSKATGEVSPA